MVASNPCVPSPCGPNSQCRVVDTHAACSCLPNFIGRAPNCRPECTINAECSAHLACQCDKCVDPCPGSCGALATCRVVNHQPVCTCPPGYTGDPFSGCSPNPSKICAQFPPLDRFCTPCTYYVFVYTGIRAFICVNVHFQLSVQLKHHVTRVTLRLVGRTLSVKRGMVLELVCA